MPTMSRSAWVAVGTAAAVMTIALGWGTVTGDLYVEGGALLRMPWGLVSLVEIYVGVALFSYWVFWREASPARASAWIVGIVLMGNIVSCAYVALALRAAHGDSIRFWMGAHAPGTSDR